VRHFTVVESAIKVDGLDPGVKAAEDTEEPSEDTTLRYRRLFETAYRQRVAFVLHTRVEWYRRGTQWFHASLPSDRGRLCRLRHRRRPQVEVCADLHPFGEQFIEILRRSCSDPFELFRLSRRSVPLRTTPRTSKPIDPVSAMSYSAASAQPVIRHERPISRVRSHQGFGFAGSRRVCTVG